jgi:glycosyltransferase involved in cell wall biosynthesis
MQLETYSGNGMTKDSLIKNGDLSLGDGLRISVVIINYNYGEFIEKCIRSVLEQSYRAYQIVVVDDGSSDNSKLIIEKFTDIVEPIFQPQSGHVEAANSGFSRVCGEVCIFLDADDLLYEKCLANICDNWNSNIAKMQFRLDTIDRDGFNQDMPFPKFNIDLTSSEVQRQAIEFGVYPWTVSSGNAYSVSFLRNVFPIDSKVIYRSPDGYLNKIAPLFGEVKSVTNVLGAYRVHGRNAWAQDGKNVKTDALVRWLNFDLVLHKAFSEHAQKRGHTINTTRHMRSLQQLEHRLLVCRISPKENPHARDNRLNLFVSGLKFLPDAPNISIFGKAIWLIWIFVMAFLPKLVVRKVFLSGRGQIGRGKLFRLLVKISNIKILTRPGAGG